MKVKMIPMKGKGHEVTARNLAAGEAAELSRPLTTDPWDNAIIYEIKNTAGDQQRLGRSGAGDGVRRELPDQHHTEGKIARRGRHLPDADRRKQRDICL